MKKAIWTKPPVAELKREYEIEYLKKGLSKQNLFADYGDFLRRASEGEVVEVTPQMDRKIEYRSHTRDQADLLSLIKSYRSYPQFRNENTLQTLYDRISTGQSMTMPIVLRWSNGRMRVFAGNTRMDVARHVGQNPKVLMIDVD